MVDNKGMRGKRIQRPGTWLLATLLFIALIVAGCSSDVSSADTSPTSTSSVPPATDEAEAPSTSSSSSTDQEAVEDETEVDSSGDASTDATTEAQTTNPTDEDKEETAPDATAEPATEPEIDLELDETVVPQAEPVTTEEPDEAAAAPEVPEQGVQSQSGNAELDAVVDELAAYVEQERGLNFIRSPQVQLLNEAEFAQAWLQLITDDAAENATSYRDFTDIYQAVGIISSDRTLEDIWRSFGSAAVLGYYETDSESVVLRNGEINTLTKTTLVHELVHVLEDQHFDLDREEYSDRDDEIGWAFSALVEGSARVIENRYRAGLSDAERADEANAINALSLGGFSFNSSFLELQFGRYNHGEDFVDALWSSGQSILDETFAAPPTASELVLDPRSFLSGAAVDPPLDAPPADGPIFEQGVWGEAAWIALLSDVPGLSATLGRADGWGGDWYVAWRDGDETCVRIDVETDDLNAFATYESALEQWSDQAGGRELTEPTEGLLRLTSCG